MANAKKRGARFVFTRIATGASAVILTSALWAGVAATAPQKTWDNAQAETEQPPVEVYEQDGWRWDPDRQEWLPIEETAPNEVQVWSGGGGERPVYVIEQQDVVYYVFQWQPDDQGGGEWVQVPSDGKGQPPKTASVTPRPATAGVPVAGGVPTSAPQPASGSVPTATKPAAAPTKPPLPGWVPTSTPVPADTPVPAPIPGGGGGGGTPSNPPPAATQPPASTATPKPKPTATPTKSKAS